MSGAEHILDRETADDVDIDADLAAPVTCTGCQRPHPRYALDTTGRCPTCPAADRHPCVVRARVADTRGVTALLLAIITGAYLTTWDRVELDARADADRDAWIAALEAETEAPPPPWSSQWDPAHDALGIAS